MEKITVSRELEVEEEEVRKELLDLEPFMEAAGFDEVDVDGDTVEVANEVGPKRIELVLELKEEADAVLTYEQVEGIFREMETVYTTEERYEGTRVEATTTFELDTAVIGSFLDATVIKIKRKRELNAQFDYLEA